MADDLLRKYAGRAGALAAELDSPPQRRKGVCGETIGVIPILKQSRPAVDPANQGGRGTIMWLNVATSVKVSCDIKAYCIAIGENGTKIRGIDTVVLAAGSEHYPMEQGIELAIVEGANCGPLVSRARASPCFRDMGHGNVLSCLKMAFFLLAPKRASGYQLGVKLMARAENSLGEVALS